MLPNAAEVAKIGPKTAKSVAVACPSAAAFAAIASEFDYIAKRQKQRVARQRFAIVKVSVTRCHALSASVLWGPTRSVL